LNQPEEINRAEQTLLKALCQGFLRGPEATRVRTRLAGYCWREPIHQAIFRALHSIPFTDPKIIRDLLPARLTRYGFPDVPLEDLYEPLPESPPAVEEIVEWLVENG
jgi:hypothetical protein